MSNVEIFDTTFAMTILVVLALVVPTALLVANWFLHPGKIKGTSIKGSPTNAVSRMFPVLRVNDIP